MACYHSQLEYTVEPPLMGTLYNGQPLIADTTHVPTTCNCV